MKSNIELIRENLDPKYLRKVEDVIGRRPRDFRNAIWFGEFYFGFLLYIDGRCLNPQQELDVMWLGIFICGNACKTDNKIMINDKQVLDIMVDMLNRITQPILPDSDLWPSGISSLPVMYMFPKDERDFCADLREKIIQDWHKPETEKLELAFKNMMAILKIMYWYMLSGSGYAGWDITDENWEIIENLMGKNNWDRLESELKSWLLEAKINNKIVALQ